MNQMGKFSVGNVTVRTNTPTPEYYAERMMAKIFHVSATAPPEVKEQVKAFQGQLYKLLVESAREIMENK